jgi:hypothetical protein
MVPTSNPFERLLGVIAELATGMGDGTPAFTHEVDESILNELERVLIDRDALNSFFDGLETLLPKPIAKFAPIQNEELIAVLASGLRSLSPTRMWELMLDPVMLLGLHDEIFEHLDGYWWALMVNQAGAVHPPSIADLTALAGTRILLGSNQTGSANASQAGVVLTISVTVAHQIARDAIVHELSNAVGILPVQPEMRATVMMGLSHSMHEVIIRIPLESQASDAMFAFLARWIADALAKHAQQAVVSLRASIKSPLGSIRIVAASVEFKSIEEAIRETIRRYRSIGESSGGDVLPAPSGQ